MCDPPAPDLWPLPRLIKHTKQLLEENEERLCIKVLQTLREMMTKDRGYGEKVPTYINMALFTTSQYSSGSLYAGVYHDRKQSY